MARGGKRRPANPAPVSGPGALSQRTDGGPADRQAVRVASGGAYGERQAMEQLQSAAPMAAAPDAPTGAAPPRSPLPPAPMPNVFGPTEFPNEPGTAGINRAPSVIPQDPDMLIRYLYSLYPHPAIGRLINPEA